jgi:hypothetical protein
VEAFFPKIAEFQKPPHHVKWRDVNLAADLPGWKRFDAAQAWLDQNNGSASNQSAAAEQATGGPRPVATSSTGARSAGGAERSLPPRDSALYKEFMRWKQTRGR